MDAAREVALSSEAVGAPSGTDRFSHNEAMPLANLSDADVERRAGDVERKLLDRGFAKDVSATGLATDESTKQLEEGLADASTKLHEIADMAARANSQLDRLDAMIGGDAPP